MTICNYTQLGVRKKLACSLEFLINVDFKHFSYQVICIIIFHSIDINQRIITLIRISIIVGN